MIPGRFYKSDERMRVLTEIRGFSMEHDCMESMARDGYKDKIRLFVISVPVKIGSVTIDRNDMLEQDQAIYFLVH